MEPNYTNPNINNELPQPESTGGDFAAEQSAPAPETQHGAPMTQATHNPGQNATNPFAPGAVPPSNMPQLPNGQLTQQLIADDADLIEKEWVLKAKAIVMHTKDDPHKQNQEMNKVKADYLKKRYNKDLKINED